ncbi:alpha/beta hydrolase [Leptospira dzoumogneensis]|uniref:Alpha/beta hydrolase n=1 Tax=Leptospira dzoumogneensis TaxID=2484904 RepID=A0A4Z1AB53_9LEPT|nr:alpha/beta hydrolase [Leptospira dzoumogneensis]TGM97717.1 alpha/beta hydrolase [Leptospira dzoumogneensis]
MLWQKFETLAARALLSLPNSILRIFGKDTKRGRTLDPKVRTALLLAKIKPKPENLPPPKARELFKNIMSFFDLKKEEVPRVENFSIPGTGPRIKVRLYSSNITKELEPCLLYFHGGGFVIGDLESHDAPLRYLAKTSGRAILAVDYRLGPEHTYPSSWEDAYSAYKWVKENGKSVGIDPKKIAVAGDSAGGNLAISISTRAKKEKLALPQFQILIYPWIDLIQERKSVEEFENGYALTRDLLRYFKYHSVPNSKDWKDPRVTPFQQTNFSHTPKTYMLIAGFDPLQDEGLAYTDLLRKAKVKLEIKTYETLIHGFFNLGRSVPEAKNALDQIAKWIQTGFLGK